MTAPRLLFQALQTAGLQPRTLAKAAALVYHNRHIVLAFDGEGSLTHRYLHGPLVDQILADEALFDDEVYWALADNLGTVRTLLDSQGNRIRDLVFAAWGEITQDTNPSVDFPFAFTGREYDRETGLYFYRARYYAPRTGRFISADPLGFAAGDTNLSRYVGNSPTRYVDPHGLSPDEAEPSEASEHDERVEWVDVQGVPGLRVGWPARAEREQQEAAERERAAEIEQARAELRRQVLECMAKLSRALRFRTAELPPLQGGMILGTHTNNDTDGDETPGERNLFGHSWISVWDPKNNHVYYFATYSDHTIRVHRCWKVLYADNNVTFDAEKQFGYWDGIHYRFWQLEPAQAEVLERLLSERHNWTWTNNCTSFAWLVWATVTGEDIDPDGTGHMEEPAELGNNIEEANANNPTGVSRPIFPPRVQVNGGAHDGSS